MIPKIGAESVVHLITVVFVGAVLWMLQSLISSVQADRLVLIQAVDRISAVEVRLSDLKDCD